jgi:hypothetical protein
MQPVFQQALRPPRHIVLGTVMQPLTLGHVWLLHRETEILEDEIPHLDCLIAACMICMLPHNRFESISRKWWINLLLKWWGWRCRKLDFLLEHQKFGDYMTENCAQPEWKAQQGKMRSLSSPWHIRMVAMLMSELGMTKAEALDTRVIEASALLTCAAEAAGEIDLWSDSSEELWNRALSN